MVSQNVQKCEIIDLLDFRIEHYVYDCAHRGQDNFFQIVQKMIDSDEIVFATPVYWYAMSGYLKVFFDRMTELITTNKILGRRLEGKSVRLLACGTDAELPLGFETPFRLTAEYFNMDFISTDYYRTKD